MSIRRALPADCDELTVVAHAAKRHWRYPEELIRLWRDALTVTPALVLHDPVYVAMEGDEIVGFYALTGAPPALELEHFWVRPERMRRGVGTTLFAHALEVVRTSGATSLEIASDPNAEPFYEKMGARRIGEVPSTPPGRVLPLLQIHVA